MKPMIALIATGIILLLIMLYFGNKSFEGTFETNVYQNSVKYNKTAPVIIELETMISNVKLDTQSDYTLLTYNTNFSDKYNNLKIAKIEITYPNKPDILNVTEINNNGESFEGINKKLPSGLYLVVFHFFIDNGNDTIKVIKSVYVE